MRSIAKALALLLLCLGVVLLTWGVWRYRLPYEEGRYFDPETQVVYHSQTAELFLITAIVLIVAGLGIAGAAFRFLRAKS